MKISNFYFLLSLGLILLIIVDGRRGGGSRGGGSRGSSSRGSSSRGSSGRTSSSQSSQSSRGTYEHKTSKDSGSDSAPTHVRPSAPEAPSVPNQNRQPAYNPNYKPDTNVGHSANQQPPPYPGGSSNPNMGHPPPYPGQNQPRPPPYDTRPNPSGGSGNPPPYPQQPGSAPYPRQPGSAPYPQQPGSGHYPQQPGYGYQPYPRQPGYPQQPGSYPPPPYVQNSGFPVGGNAYVKPYKKQGLLGQVFSGLGSKKHKTPKYGAGYGGGYGGGYGAYPGMSHSKNPMGIPKAMYPMMPLMMKAKKPNFFSPSFRRPSFIFLPLFNPFHSPFHSHNYYYHHGYYRDIESENYRGRCIKPFKPENSSMDCDTTESGATCTLKCDEGYHFEDNATAKEHKCWHISGVWRPSKIMPKCLPSCGDKCLNGGKCAKPGVCVCNGEYRGERCEHHLLKCDIRKLAGENSHNIGWACSHTHNITECNVRCRTGQFADEPQNRKYQCQITGEWTPGSIPDCITETNSTSTAQTETTATAILTIVP